MNMEKDILENIGNATFKVPEGYFESLQERLGRIPSGQDSLDGGIWTKVRPYVALAACFLVAFAIGTAILRTTASRTDPDQLYKETIFAEMVSVPQPEAYFFGLEEETSTLSNEDIINFLIDTGVSAEQIEFTREER